MKSKIAFEASSLTSSTIYRNNAHKNSLANYLIILIEPEEGKVCYTYWFPMIGDLLARAVDDVSYLVSHNELKILHEYKLNSEHYEFF